MTKWLSLIVTLFVLLSGCAATEGVYHVVQNGQTLYRISRAYGVDERHIARINGVDDPTRMRPGTRLFIPGASQVKSVASTPRQDPPPPARQAPRSVALPPAATNQTSRPRPEPPPVQTSRAPRPEAPAPVPSPPAARGKFIYPVKGKVLRGFGQKNGAVSKGIEIAAPSGSAVLSSAAGQVIYSGDGVKGYGNLIILKHDDSFYTVYGFNQANLVNAGTFVGQGQKIALSGSPPAGGNPRLHFEIRQGKQAVDPIFYLP